MIEIERLIAVIVSKSILLFSALTSLLLRKNSILVFQKRQINENAVAWITYMNLVDDLDTCTNLN